MSVLIYIGVVISHICFVTMFLIIGDLSRILGVALKKKPVYRLMYLGSIFILSGMILNFFSDLLLYSILLDTLGVSVACFVTYYYWNWLPSDLSKG